MSIIELVKLWKYFDQHNVSQNQSMITIAKSNFCFAWSSSIINNGCLKIQSCLLSSMNNGTLKKLTRW